MEKIIKKLNALAEHSFLTSQYSNSVYYNGKYAAYRRAVSVIQDAMKEERQSWVLEIEDDQRVWRCPRCGMYGEPHWKRCPICEAKMKGEGSIESRPD